MKVWQASRPSLYRPLVCVLLAILTVAASFGSSCSPPALAESASPAQRTPQQASADAAPSADAAALANTMELPPPDLRALISITARLDPFQLDAQSSQAISLNEVVQQVVARNLDIRIQNTDVQAKKWTLLSSCGQFLPNENLGYRWQYLKGTLHTPISGGDSIRLNSPLIIATAGYTYYAFRGGKILFTALQNRNYLRAARHQLHATISDALLEATRRYYNLVLSEAQLQIRVKAVRTSEEQLELDENLLQGGKATMLDVLQARTQLASDRQALIDQQIARRTAAINLADYLDLDQSVDLVSRTRTLDRITLVSGDVTPTTLVVTAIRKRPELKQYEELRLAAKKAIPIAAAPLMPTFQTFGSIFGIGETLSDSSRISLNPINLSSTSLFGSPVGGAVSVPHRVSRQIAPLYTIGYQLQWNVTGLGTSDFANVRSAKYQARQAMLELNKQLNSITNQVRQSFLNTLSTSRKIEETTAKVDSSAEELRLSQLRFQYGVGKNIDVIKAQQDYTSALIENSQALISFNIAQAQLLRDLGIISIARLTARQPAPLTE